MSGQLTMAVMPIWKAILNAVAFQPASEAARPRPRNGASSPSPEPCDAAKVFESEVQIRFAHCDPAGIVFYPQYFVILNGLMEDWFTEGLGVDFADMVTKRKIGIPTARIDCTFSRPSYLGERLTLGVTVTRIGNRSISIEVLGTVNGETRLKAVQTIVMFSLATMKSIPIPADIRKALPRYCHQGAETAMGRDD